MSNWFFFQFEYFGFRVIWFMDYRNRTSFGCVKRVSSDSFFSKSYTCFGGGTANSYTVCSGMEKNDTKLCLSVLPK